VPLPFTIPETYVPLGILSLVAILEENQACEVEILDFSIEIRNGIILPDKEFYTNAGRKLKEIGADIYGFSTRPGSYIQTLSIAKSLKEQQPEATIIFGGSQASATDVLTLERFPFVDIIVRGEGEKPILEIVKRLEQRQSIEDVKSVTFRGSNGRIVRNPRGLPIENLDELPIPAYYRYKSIISGYSTEKPKDDIHSYVPVDTGRGCVYNCRFCYSHDFWGGKHRAKSIDRIVKEINYLNEDFGVNDFFFPEDMFTVSRKRVLDFCETLKTSGLEVKWNCYSRIDSMDRPLLEMMAESGCATIYYGVESGSSSVLKSLKKEAILSRAQDVIEDTVQCGIRAITSLIVGFPEETYEDISKTMNMFLDFIDLGAVSKLHVLGVHYGTPLYEENSLDLSPIRTLNQAYFENQYLISKEQLELIEMYPDIFSYYYYIKNSHFDKNFIKVFKIEQIFPIFRDSIRNLRPNLEQSFDLIKFLDEWCKKNQKNQKNEWLASTQARVNEFALFLKDLSTLILGSDSLHTMIDCEAQAFLTGSEIPYEISKTSSVHTYEMVLNVHQNMNV